MKRKFTMIIACLMFAYSVTTVFAGSDFTSVSAYNENVIQTEKNVDLPVKIKAKSAILMEVSSGSVLLEYNADKKMYPASVTKIMTMLLVTEAISAGKISLTDTVTCSKNAASKGGSQIWLEEGETMTVDELLKATVIGSANDAATLLGEYVAGSEEAFVSLMNTRAKELKMNNTNFENATGLDDTSKTHLTTARDIGIMSCELLKHDIIRNYSTVWMDSLRDGKTELVNTNKLVRFYNGTTGLKTGTTEKAGCCVSASAERDGFHIVAVVMGAKNSNDRFETAKSMLTWGFSNYTTVTPAVDENLITDVKVLNGESESVKPKIPATNKILIKKGDEEKITQEVELPVDVEAPVLEGQKLGTLSFSLNGKIISSYDLNAQSAVDRLSFFTSLKRITLFLLTGERA